MVVVCKKLIPFINGENELSANIITMAEDYCFAGADELFLYIITIHPSVVQ